MRSDEHHQQQLEHMQLLDYDEWRRRLKQADADLAWLKSELDQLQQRIRRNQQETIHGHQQRISV